MARRGTIGAERYSGVAQAFHWTIALLIITNLVIGLGHEYNDQWGSIPLHKSIGMTVLALSVLRLIWRLMHRPPALPRDVTPLQKGLAHALHWTFYLLMLVLPFSGWLLSSAGAKYPIGWFGLFNIPYLPVQGDKVLGDRAFAVHHYLGWIFVPLILLHLGAALWHHYGQRDTVLLRMMPGARPV